MLDLLTRLVDKSLVVAEAQGGEARYRLLETVRQYAEREAAGGRRGGGGARPARATGAWRWPSGPTPQLSGARPGGLARRGWRPSTTTCGRRWSWSHGRAGRRRGRAAAGRGAGAVLALAGLPRRGAGAADGGAGARRRGGAAGGAGAGAAPGPGGSRRWTGDLGRARAQLEESRALALAAGDWRLAALATRHLALVAAAAGDLAERRALLEEALRLARRAGEPRELTWALGFLAHDLLVGG